MQSEARSHEHYAPMGRIKIEEASDLYRYFLPYVILLLSDGSYIFLNRFYKPVGMMSHDEDWVDYEACSPRFTVRGLTPEIASKISVRGSADVRWITLYDDGCRPQDSDKNRRAHLQRLKLFYDLVEIQNFGSVRASVH
jgi:hypothetical protein